MGWPVVALCLVQFVDVLGVTVVVTTLPAMLGDVGAEPADGTLVAVGYAMFFGGLLMFGARLGDRFGHRRCILGSLVAFAAGSLLTATASTVVLLSAGRCLQGAAAAIAVPSALRLLTAVAADERQRARAVAAWSAAGAAAGASGFVVGGLVTAAGSWRLIFWGLLGVSAVLAVAIVRFVPARAAAPEGGSLNLAGSVLLTGAVMAAILFGEAPWLLAVAAVLAALFVVVDRRSPAPLLLSGVLRLPQVRRGAGGAFFNTATTGVVTLVTLHLQGALGRTPLEAAATLLPLSLAVIPGSALAARLIVRRPAERVAAAGLLTIGAGLALPLLGPASPVLIGAGVAAAGFGLGLASVATTSLATDVPEQARATSAGLANTSAQLGTALGTAALLLLAGATTGVPGATGRTPWVAWAAAAILAFVAAVLIDRRLPSGRGTTPAR
ncbi:MFS transporter [Actinoplanes sp. TRM 88003]|uniref:MFS transporter n=1 Tax=Paractinoplanes aksuensis TaxID=2939490 RepID=A0ABT1DPK0_9ACTN|nr:MFS transporter [Actinoplanes aksuensis]MCO8272772.1 MFS transporter [Actinoplanes aksuensis]